MLKINECKKINLKVYENSIPKVRLMNIQRNKKEENTRLVLEAVNNAYITTTLPILHFIEKSLGIKHYTLHNEFLLYKRLLEKEQYFCNGSFVTDMVYHYASDKDISTEKLLEIKEANKENININEGTRKEIQRTIDVRLKGISDKKDYIKFYGEDDKEYLEEIKEKYDILGWSNSLEDVDQSNIDYSSIDSIEKEYQRVFNESINPIYEGIKAIEKGNSFIGTYIQIMEGIKAEYPSIDFTDKEAIKNYFIGKYGDFDKGIIRKEDLLLISHMVFFKVNNGKGNLVIKDKEGKIKQIINTLDIFTIQEKYSLEVYNTIYSECLKYNQKWLKEIKDRKFYNKKGRLHPILFVNKVEENNIENTFYRLINAITFNCLNGVYEVLKGEKRQRVGKAQGNKLSVSVSLFDSMYRNEDGTLNENKLDRLLKKDTQSYSNTIADDKYLFDYLKRLLTKEQLVITNMLFEGITQRDIAKTLKIGNTKISKTKEILRDIMEKYINIDREIEKENNIKGYKEDKAISRIMSNVVINKGIVKGMKKSNKLIIE